jgi:hypothetical protein
MTGICHRFQTFAVVYVVRKFISFYVSDNVSVHCNAVKHPALSNNTIFEESEAMGCDVIRFLQNTFTSCYDRLFAGETPVCKMRGA